MKLAVLALVFPLLGSGACSPAPVAHGDASTNGGVSAQTAQATGTPAVATSEPAPAAGGSDVRTVRGGANPVTCNMATRVCSDGEKPEDDHNGHVLDASKARSW